MSDLSDPEIKSLLQNNTPFIDVRAPIEYAEGSIPNSINLPIMNDSERAEVGKTYKERGQAEAIRLGHQLIHGKVKEERISAWMNQLKISPQTKIFCLRGGLRSQITCEWIRERGIEIYPIPGGYKRIRKTLITQLEVAPFPACYRIGGLTGSGKTQLIRSFQKHIDLEELAHHRGSSFGTIGRQPSQTTFENHLAHKLIMLEKQKILLEDESATIGKIVIPVRFRNHLRNSPLIILETTLEERIRNIFEEYVSKSPKDFFLAGIDKIKKRFSKDKLSELLSSLHQAYEKKIALDHHAPWISLLLTEYYDPLYAKGLKEQKNHLCFQGDKNAVVEYLKDHGLM